MNKYVTILRSFLKSNNADAILINSSDEFLSEYNILALNSRYKITSFTGSMGDCIVTQDKIFQIADGRYHEQADNEVNHDLVTVIKTKQGDTPISHIVRVLAKNSTLIVTANKVSAYFCEKLSEECREKNISIKYINNDPVDDLNQNTYTNVNLSLVDKTLTGLSEEEKFKYFSSYLNDNQIILVTAPVNFAYLTNLRNYDFPYSSAPRAKAVVSRDEVIIFTNSKIPFKFKGLKVKKLSSFRSALSNMKNKEVLTDKKSISQADFMHIDSSNIIINSDIFDIKSEKTDCEIAHLKSAFARTDAVLREMDRLINSKKSLSEYDLYCAITELFTKAGAKAQSFRPIIAAGANSSIIHYSVASKTKMIKNGDLVMVDCGGFFEGGIATDITRTFVRGKPTDEQKRIYTQVFKAFVSTYTKKYSSETTWKDIDTNTRKRLKSEEKTGWLFSHSTGHGIGISVHEHPPVCAPFDTYKQPFKKHYVFSIEPGLYKKGVGGVRLENAVYVKSVDDKLQIEVLSHYPFEEKLIDKKLLTKKELKFLEEWQNYDKNNNFTI